MEWFLTKYALLLQLLYSMGKSKKQKRLKGFEKYYRFWVI